MRNIESRTQQACVRYFRLQYPRYAGCFFSVPNGGRRDTVTGAILKAEGALAGVADLFLSVPNNVHHGLYVEMKTRKGRQQDSQKAFQKAVEAQGYRYEICRSLDDFMALIKDYLNG
ncbi:VRR-NUC domain-containing protein [Parabacteroides distasonis]|uniref:VRR-NUC domain-containing protein n=1 Tax=Parabacteroides distasonis TaxID=823 RepID=UPI003F97DB14